MDALKHESRVVTLKLGWCKLGPKGGAAAADLLMYLPSLTTLDLRGNGLGPAGAASLGRALREAEGEGLVELDLGYNEVKDDGACALAQALKANPTAAPRSLKVNANYIGRFGQVALTEALDMVAELGGGRDITIVF